MDEQQMREKIAQLEKENQRLKDELRELNDRYRETKDRLFTAKDEIPVKRITFHQVFKRLDRWGINLERLDNGTFVVTYQYIEKVLKRQFKKLKQIWDFLRNYLYDAPDDEPFMELLKELFPQLNRRLPVTKTPNQHRPCCFCGMLINWRYTPAEETPNSTKKPYRPYSLDGTRHRCREVNLSPDLTEIIQVA
jgi:hypothetical protein